MNFIAALVTSSGTGRAGTDHKINIRKRFRINHNAANTGTHTQSFALPGNTEVFDHLQYLLGHSHGLVIVYTVQ